MATSLREPSSYLPPDSTTTISAGAGAEGIRNSGMASRFASGVQAMISDTAPMTARKAVPYRRIASTGLPPRTFTRRILLVTVLVWKEGEEGTKWILHHSSTAAQDLRPSFPPAVVERTLMSGRWDGYEHASCPLTAITTTGFFRRLEH